MRRKKIAVLMASIDREYQQDFAQILRMQKEIGVSLTESLLMIPTKSVTAIIGITGEKQKCVLQGCEECEQAKVCAFSRNRMDSDGEG